MNDNLRKRVSSNLTWRLLERFGAQGVTIIVSIVLARLLEPEAFGTIAIVMVFTTILQVFVDSGMGNALIQKKDADDIDFSTVFYFNIFLCIILYAAIFFAAPFISSFYNNPELTPLIRVLGLTVLISGIKNVQQAFVSKNLLFKNFFFATIGGTVGAAIIGVAMAYLGYGVWALVFQHLFNLLIDTIILWIVVSWRPKKVFSIQRFKGLYSFGWKLLFSSLIDTTYNELRQLFIGKYYSSSDLAFYNKARQFPNTISTNINSSIKSVLFPVMSFEQQNKERVKSMMRRSIKVGSYLITPIMVGLAVCAEPLVCILLTDKWLPAVFYLRIFCIMYAFYPVHTASLSAIKSLGRSGVVLRIEIINKTIGLTCLFVTIFISMKAVAYGLVFLTLTSLIVNAIPCKKILNYHYSEQICDLLPHISLSLFMGFIVFFVNFLGLPNWLTLICQIFLGIFVYFVLSALFKLDSFIYLKQIITSYKKRKK